jgi:cysteine desulfurase
MPEVFEAMLPYSCEEWGNPSSTYKFGSKLKGAMGTARAQVAELIERRPTEVIFTSCATKGTNAGIHVALKGSYATGGESKTKSGGLGAEVQAVSFNVA